MRKSDTIVEKTSEMPKETENETAERESVKEQMDDEVNKKDEEIEAAKTAVVGTEKEAVIDESTETAESVDPEEEPVVLSLDEEANDSENEGEIAPEGEVEQEAIPNEDQDIPEDTTTESNEKAETAENRSIYDLLEEEIMSSDIPAEMKARRISKLLKVRGQKVNLMLVGATGSGKSSTVNAIFDMEVAKVGTDVDPETDEITKYELDNLIIWDTPGLGDGKENDERITRSIVKKLSELDSDGKSLIDLAIVILDASSKDLGTSYEVINEILIPCLGEEAKERILIAINQCDMAMKGNHWDAESNAPDDILMDFLEKKMASVQARIEEATGLNIEPVYYCAGYKEDGEDQRKPYNLTKLLYYIVKTVPKDKRLALADHINKTEDNWLYDDMKADYRVQTGKKFSETVRECISESAENGFEIGAGLLGIPGGVVGLVIGAAVGVVSGFINGVRRSLGGNDEVIVRLRGKVSSNL